MGVRVAGPAADGGCRCRWLLCCILEHVWRGGLASPHGRARACCQVAVIEAAQNVLGQKDAASEEFVKDSKNPVIVFMPEGSKTHMGGTMRLGTRRTVLKDDKCITGWII